MFAGRCSAVHRRARTAGSEPPRREQCLEVLAAGRCDPMSSLSALAYLGETWSRLQVDTVEREFTMYISGRLALFSNVLPRLPCRCIRLVCVLVCTLISALASCLHVEFLDSIRSVSHSLSVRAQVDRI